MRRAILFFIISTAAVLLFLVHTVWILLELLMYSGTEDAILPRELPALAAKDQKATVHTPMIPRIIHQTYINTSIPEQWEHAQASCRTLHPEPEWKYWLWTDADGLAFIADKYPEYLETFTGYEYPIQRADAIRYFVLEYYGGIYIDLDDGCNRSLEPLLAYPAWVRKTVPTGISNDVMGSVPHHPFFRRVIHELQPHNHGWLLPYITVMASTGPLFLSIIWRHYGDEGLNLGDSATGGRVRILFPDEYNKQAWSFFVHHVGNSWHSYDAQLIFWMAHHWIIITIAGFVVGISLLMLSFWYYQRYFMPKSDIPRWKAYALRNHFHIWQDTSDSGSERDEYELYPHDEDERWHHRDF